MRRRELLEDLAQKGLTIDHARHCADPARCEMFEDWRCFTLHGVEFSVSVPRCHSFPLCWDGGMWADWLTKFFGVAIVHRNVLERIAGRRSAELVEPDDWPAVYEALRGRHTYHCVRDVAHLMPPKTLCFRCRRPVFWPKNRDERRTRSHYTQEHGYRYEYFCTEECLMRQRQMEWNVERKRQKEMRWLRKGTNLLRQCRQLINDPAKLQEASRLPNAASTPDESSRH